MTQPPTPTPKQTAADFAERMKYVASQDFGGTFRPGLVQAIANGTLSADQMTQVTNFVKALDLAKAARANASAGIGAETSPADSDLLMTIGEDKSIVQRANSTVVASGNPDHTSKFLNNTFQTIAQYSANSGDLLLPQPNSFAPGHKAPDGSSNDSIPQKIGHGIMTGLSWIGRVPGFLYQSAMMDLGALTGDTTNAKSVKRAMVANGNYDPSSPLSTLAYLWSHGESDFNDLGPVRAQYGSKLVDTVLAMFNADTGYGSAARTLTGNINYQNALANYQGFLNAQLQQGKITPQQYAQRTEALSDPMLEKAYTEVDGKHVSFGRDLAHNVGLDPSTGAGRYVSGIGDFAWSMFADPTIVGAKAKAGLTAARYGLESLGDASKVSKLYGVADKVTGEVPHLNPVLNAGAFQARRRVTGYLGYLSAIRTAEQGGERDMAASLYAEAAARYPDLMPSYMEAQGWRAASTPEELAKAKKDGTTLSLGGDAVHEAMAPSRGGRSPEEIARNVQAFKDASIPAVQSAKPLETIDDWVNWLTAQGGLYRWASGLSARQARVLPGKMGFVAEARASAMGRLAFNRVLRNAPRNPLILSLAAAAGHMLTDDEKAILDQFNSLSAMDTEADAGKIVASDESEGYKTAWAARHSGQQIGGRDAGSWLNFARSLGAKIDTVNRRLTTWLPTNHIIALNSAQASKDIERFVRTFMSKDVASTARYLWDNAQSESARRQIGRAIANQVADASGITRTPAGRAWMEQWNVAYDEMEHARYGYADTDKIPDVFRGERRVAMHLSQLETHLVLPAFKDMRRVAAKGAILGFDQPLDQIGSKFTLNLKKLIAGDTPMKGFTTNADGTRDILNGMRHMLASPSLTIRYGLFNNYLLTRMFGLMKLGWLATTSNMVRQFAEEYVGLRLGRHGSDLAEGKRLLRADGHTFAIVQKAHHLIPHFLRQSISSEDDVYHAVTRGKLAFSWGDRPLDDTDRQIVSDLSDMLAQREVGELLGARQATIAEGGVEDAMDAHKYDVLMQRVGWKRRQQLAGYSEKEMADLNGDTGRRALAAYYVSAFIDKDEPARRALAYLMWNHAAKNPEFLAKLDPETVKLMKSLVPPVYDTENTTFSKMWGQAAHTNSDVEHHVMPVDGSKTGKLGLVKYDLKGGGYREEQPLKYIYRVVSRDDYERMKASGVLDTDGRSAHGQYDENGNDLGPLMFGSAVPTKIARAYGAKNDGAVMLKIKYRVKDGWKKDTSAMEGQAVVSTRKSIPFDQVVDAAPYEVVDDAATGRTVLVGTDGKLKGASLDPIKDYVKNGDGAGAFRQRAEWLNRDENGLALAADDETGKDAAIERYVHSQVYNISNAVTASKDGKSLNAELVSNLLKGKTPSDYDLSKYSLKELPAHVIAAEFMPAADGKLEKLGEKLAQASAKGTKAFDHIVTNPMQRLERKPLFAGNYARAYRELQPYRDIMVEQGFSAEEARNITKRMSLGRALNDTIKYLDNPKVASQLTAIAQNFWLFYRAQEDFIRRWVGIARERPETLRLAQMGINGMVQSGMIYRDSDGNLQLSYPGSGAVIDGFLMAQHALGIGADSGVKVPSAHDLTTQLDYLNPSIMNPYGFSATPMVTIPWDLLKVAIPGHDMVKSQVDMAFNGQLGNGRSWWEQFLPTEINRIMQLQGGNDDTGSQVGGAAATTILHASLSGKLSDKDSAVVQQEKITDLKTQTLAALWGRALFSYVAPGATSLPELDYKDKNGEWIGDPKSDISWRAMGIANMSDEYKAMIQAFGVEKANLVWAEMHPKLLPYSVGKTTVGASGATADPSLPATEWILNNQELFKGPYRRVAAYFIPPAPGTFSQVGWNAMQEIGVRQHKSIEQYYQDIVTKNAVSTWYAAKDKYESEIAAMKAAGQRTTDLEREYDLTKQTIKAEYPILTDYFSQHSSRQAERTQSISDLRKMVADPNVPTSEVPDLKGVAQMLTVLDNYSAQQAQLKGQRNNWAVTTRQELNAEYEATMGELVKKFPGLKDLYNGVFREMEQ